MKNKINESKKKKHGGGDLVSITTSNDLITIHDENVINLIYDESSWVIDTSASLHVTPRKKYFISYTYGDFGVLKMGNDDSSKIVSIGDICIDNNNGIKLLLKMFGKLQILC